MLLGFEDYRNQAKNLATALGEEYAEVSVHRFPDGESKVTLPAGLPEHVTCCRSLDRPNDKLIELLLAATAARQLGARRVSLIAPYLCYMRQDIAFYPGEAISQQIVGSFLAGLFDDVITVDPHLHRIHALQEAIPLQNSLAVSAGPAMSRFLRARDNPLLLGPDSESLQWVETIARDCGLEFGVGSKTRSGDRQVTVELPDLAMTGREIVLVDDVVSSGETVAIAASQCLQKGATRVNVLVTHALFAPGAQQRMREAGVAEIWSTDSISHASNCISLAPLLAEAAQQLAAE
ncbi:MAG: ribose-phosphate diphosphokinase [Gammaproteobacteria bacterium]|jgi:ribose-phosphate pyrophosphokinase